MDHKLTYSIPLSRLPAEMTVAEMAALGEWVDRAIEIWGCIQVIDATVKQIGNLSHREIQMLVYHALAARDAAKPGNAQSVADLVTATSVLAEEWARVRDAE